MQKETFEQTSFQALMLDNMSDAMFTFDKNTIITYWNKSAERLYGWTAEEIVGKNSAEMVRSTMSLEDRKELFNKIDQEGDYLAEIVHHTKDNKQIFVEAHIISIKDESGNLTGYLTVNRDITVRKQMEEQLRTEKKRFEILADLAGVFAKVNEDYKGVLDYTVKKLAIELGDQCVIRLVNEQGDRLVERAFYNPDKRIMDYLVNLYSTSVHLKNESFSGETIRRAKPLLIPVVTSTSEVKPEYMEYVEKFGLSSMLFVPIETEGRILGTINMYRNKPGNPFTIDDQIFLQNVASKIGFVVSKARLFNALVDQKNLLQDILELIPVGLFAIDKDGKMFIGNRMASDIWKGLEYKVQDDLVKYIGWWPSDGQQIKPEEWGSSRALKGESAIGEEILIQCFDGSKKTILNSAVPIMREGKPEGAIIAIVDISSRKQMEKQILESLREKEVLLKELYHRTKNNMQVIYSLLGLKGALTNDENTKTILGDMGNRIQSIALVHQKLYQSKNLSRIDLKEYITDLVVLLEESFYSSEKNIKISLNLEPVMVLLDTAIPCGLIINELISNSYKHAFPDNRQGDINVQLSKLEDNYIELRISDNGIGISEYSSLMDGKTLGIQLFKNIAEDQLQGEVTVDTKNGVSCSIRFKDVLYNERI